MPNMPASHNQYAKLEQSLCLREKLMLKNLVRQIRKEMIQDYHKHILNLLDHDPFDNDKRTKLHQENSLSKLHPSKTIHGDLLRQDENTH